MKEISDNLKKWREKDGDEIFEDIAEHFERTKLRDCFEIANEAREVWIAMFDEDVDTFSPQDSFISATCLQVEEGMIEAMAEMMSVDKDELSYALAYWSEDKGKGNPYQAIKSQELIDLMNRIREEEERT